MAFSNAYKSLFLNIMLMEEDTLASAVHNDDWKKLDAYISRLQIEEPSMDVWKKIEGKPLDAEFIDGMVAQKWKAVPEFMHLILDGICDYVNKVLRLNNFLSGYGRDKTLFHEMAHVRYGISDSLNRPDWHKNAAIADWVGRKSSADPELLSRAIFDFGLEVQIYDLASYNAFHGIGKLSFRDSGRLKKYYEKIGILMD